MDQARESSRDLVSMVVPQAGHLAETGDVFEPYRLVDADGVVVEAVTEYFRDLQAAGRSPATLRSYGLDLLRWFRFLWVIDVSWSRATRIEARDFCRWMLVSGKPRRSHWRHPGEPAEPRSVAEAYAPSVRAHCETVLRCFYHFHMGIEDSPILINPFPLSRSRHGSRAHAHHNPMEPFANERIGLYRPRVPKRTPRSIPDEEFNEIFARLPSHRDRALVAFYVSTGARASELLSTPQGGVDPGRQLISVVRKGTGEVQELPASTDAFVWLRLYQVQMEGSIPRGRRLPLWWTLRRPFRPLTYHAAHRMFERVNEAAGTAATLHALRHTAAYRMAEDPGLPLTDVQFVLGHAQLTTTQLYTNSTQRGRDPQSAGAPRRADPAGGRAHSADSRAKLPAGVVERAVRPRHIMTRVASAPAPQRSIGGKLGREAMRARFPPRPAAVSWPTMHGDRQTAIRLATVAPLVISNSVVQRKRVRGLGHLLDWLTDQPGGTWQQRWANSGVETLGARWRQVPIAWLHTHGRRSQWLPSELSSALLALIFADVVRPELRWLVRTPSIKSELAGGLALVRDPDGFALLSQHRQMHPEIPRRAARLATQRAAVILAAKGGPLAEITVGDVLELVDTEVAIRAAWPCDVPTFYQILHDLGFLGEQAPPRFRQLRTGGQLTPEQLVDRYRLACRPIRDLLVSYLHERQPSLDYNSLKDLSYYLARRFWKDLETHHPGIASLRLTPEVAAGWRDRLRNKQPPGSDTGEPIARIAYRECLVKVRTFYFDISQWALEDPARWASWVAPCPVGRDVDQRKFKRHRKARMDARTRERLPVLPVLITTVERRRVAAARLLAAARAVKPGHSFTADGQELTRLRTWSDRLPVTDSTGRRHDLRREEEYAFWAWAAVNVLRLTGIRIEELMEITHHSLIQYRLPTTGEIVPLLQIAPSKTDSERLLVVSPELADVLSAIIVRVRDDTGAVPLVPAYDWHECVWRPPAPALFQRRFGAENRAISHGTIRKMIQAALADTGLTDPVDGRPLNYTPHDFRRLLSA